MFENAQIDELDLPKAAGVEWQQLHPGFRRQGMLTGGFVASVIGLGLAVLQNVGGSAADGAPVLLRFLFSGFAWLPWLALFAALVSWPWISFPYRGYAVRERDILVRSGVLWRNLTAVPYNRIQHVETESSLLDRRFGIASVKLFTAGGSSGDLRIRGLAAGTSENIRVFVLDKIGAAVENG